MPLKTGRADKEAAVSIDYYKCISCGLCAKVCFGQPLYMESGKVKIDQTRFFGCIGCGQCVTVCPRDCITVEGRDLKKEDVMEMPLKENMADYEHLMSLMLSRRSVRNYQERDVKPDLVEKIVEGASTAPMGLPPSDVDILIFYGRDKVKDFRDDLLSEAQGMKNYLSPAVITVMRPFIGKESAEMLKNFVVPVINTYIEEDKKGNDYFFYNAPLAMFFYTSPAADPVDPVIAATYAMITAQSLGLGSCMLGFPAHIIKNSKKIKVKYNLPLNLQPGIVVIFGYPEVSYKKVLKRRFAGVRYY